MAINSQKQSFGVGNAGSTEKEPFSRYLTTYSIICLSTVIEKGVEQVVPALFPQLSDALGLTPSQLASFPLARALPQAILGVPCAVLVHFLNRKYASTVGCLLFGLCLCQYSILDSINSGYISMFFAGVGLAFFLPCSYSLVADTVSRRSQGAGFGTQFFVGASACGAVSFISIYVGGLIVGGFTGWRFMNMIVGLFSIGMGVLNIAFVKDPRMEQRLASKEETHWRSYFRFRVPRHGGFRAYMQSFKDCYTKKTFWVLVAQGITSQVPFNVMIFWALFFDTLKMTSVQNGSIIFVFWVCTGAGGLVFGKIADELEKYLASKSDKWQHAGRIIVAQACGVVSVILALVIFLALPKDKNSYVGFIVLCGILGAFASATQSCCTMPIIGKIVQRKNRTSAYALDRCLENPIGAIIAVFAGKLTERFGWLDPILHPDPQTNHNNAVSMANAMVIFMAVCWAASVAIMSALYWTYPKDRATKLVLEPSVVDLVQYGETAGKTVDDGSPYVKER